MATSHVICVYCHHTFDVDPDTDDSTCPSCGRSHTPETTVETVKNVAVQEPHEAEPGLSNIQVPGMELIEELGSGGFGAVYRARQNHLGRDVAIKVMHRNQDEDENEEEERFLSEAIITGNLQHPNIVPIHELGKDSHGRQFFSMKIAEGQLLSDIIYDLAQQETAAIKQYTLQRLLQIFLDVCDAVAYAHNNGIIHRDLKPNNIIVGNYGQVYVLDWGLAKIKGEAECQSKTIRTAAMARARLGVSDSLTQAGTIMGTPGYMPPEQAEGSLDMLNEQTDIFSLGVILFELICFTLPIPGKNSREIVSNTIKGKRVEFKMALHKKQHQAELAAICHKAMAHKGVDRYPSISTLSDDIRAVLNDEAVSVCQSSLMTRILRWTRHNQTRAIAIILISIQVISIALILISVSAYQAKRDKNHAQQQQELADLAQQALQKQLQAEQDALQQERERRSKSERNSQAHDFYLKAMDASNRPGQQTRAIELLTKAIALNPSFTEALFARAKIHQLEHNYDLALADCLAAHNARLKLIDSGYAHALTTAGDIWRDRTDDKANLQQALKYYRQSAAIDPDNPHAHFAQVFVNFVEQGPEQAIADAAQAIKLFPEFWEGYYLMAYLHLGIDHHGQNKTNTHSDLPTAIEYYTAAIRLNPRLAKLYQNRGSTTFMLWQQQGRRSQDTLHSAIHDLEIASMLNPNELITWRNLLRIYYQVTKDYQKAIVVTQHIERLAPQRYNMDATRAYIYEALKEYDNALDAINKALERKPDDEGFLRFKKDMQLMIKAP